MNFVDQIENLNLAKYLRPSFCEIKFPPKQVTIRGTTLVRPPPRGRRGGGTCVNFCWVCAAGLSEPLPHYSPFCGQFSTPS